VGRSALAAALLIVTASCGTEPARDELGRVELSYCETVIAALDRTEAVEVVVGR
jgi:hypothetical protein